MLFYIWEEARVLAHWNHSFDMHLSYLGPVSCAFSAWVPSGCLTGMAVVTEGLAVGSRFVPMLICLRPHHLVWLKQLNGCNTFVYWYGRQHFSFTRSEPLELEDFCLPFPLGLLVCQSLVSGRLSHLLCFFVNMVSSGILHFAPSLLQCLTRSAWLRLGTQHYLMESVLITIYVLAPPWAGRTTLSRGWDRPYCPASWGKPSVGHLTWLLVITVQSDIKAGWELSVHCSAPISIW